MSLLIDRVPSRPHPRLTRIVARILGVLAGLLLPAWAGAQSAPASQPSAGWNNGFFIQSADGQHRLQLGLLVQADGRFAVDDDARALTDTFAVRRLRPYLRGRVGDRWEFYFNPDVAGSTVAIQDAYIDTRFSTAFRLRVGKAKTPFGHERQQAASNLLFLERGFPTAIAPNRDVGIQVLGDLAGGVVSYAAGVGNGLRDGASGDLDADDNKEVAGRLVVKPFNRTPTSLLGGLGVALSGSTARQTTAASLPLYRTAVFQQTFFSYAGATADGRLRRYSPYVFYYRKVFGAFGEYVTSEVPVKKGAVREQVGHHAWQAAASWVLTGESATEGGVVPRNNFNFGNGHWGALQIAARYQALEVDRAAFDRGLAADGSNRTATAWSTGLNWYLTRNVKYVFLFERTVFDGDVHGTRRPENVFAFRTQLNF
jgi:phosphate-selective porin OprO/OprP